MGFGQSNSEKQNDSAVKDITKQQRDISEGAATKGDKAFKFFKQSAAPAKDFWSNILTGDRSKIMELLGPEISTVKDTAKGERDSNTALNPRGGMRASGYTDSANKEASTIGDAVLKARPTAAQQLMNLAQIFSGTSTAETGLALTGSEAASGNLFNLNKEAQQNRQNQAQFWGQLGGSAGSLIGQLLLPHPGGGGG